MQETLVKVWKSCGTKRMAKIFKSYMQEIGAVEIDTRKNVNDNTYLINGRTWNWHKVSCRYYKEFTNYAAVDFEIVLRKEMGSYLLIRSEDVRVFEIDHHGLLVYNETLLTELIGNHRPLFDALFAIAK